MRTRSRIARLGRKFGKMAEDGERVQTDDGGSQDEKEDSRNEGQTLYTNRNTRTGTSDMMRPTVLNPDEPGINIENKVYYLDAIENLRGRFCKITEIFRGKSKARIFVPSPFWHEFKDMLSTFADFYATLDPSGETENKYDEERRGQPLKSDHIFHANRRFYFDLKQNNRGYFLKVSQPAVSSARRNIPHRLAIPGQGLAEIRDHFAKIVDEHGMDEEEEEANLPEAKEVRVEHKRFYFDVGSNNRGVFVRLSEVTSNYRACVTIPRRGWERVRDSLNDLCSKLPPDAIEEQASGGGGGDYE